MVDGSMGFGPRGMARQGQSQSRREELRGATAPRPVILQKELDEMRDLARRLRQVEARRRELRESLLERLSSGAAVEPGRFAARLIERTYRILSAKKLLPCLGEKETSRLQRLVDPTVYRTLVIEERF